MMLRSIVICCCLVGQSFGADCENRERASLHYQNGVKQYRIGQFETAAREFQQSYELCSEPALLYNLAQTFRTAGDAKKALFFYRQYKSAAPSLDPERRREVDRRIAELEELLAKQSKAQEAPPTGVVGPDAERRAAPTSAAGSEAARPVPPAAGPAQPAPSPQAEKPRHWYNNSAAWGVGTAGLVMASVGIGLAASAPGLNDGASNAPTLPQAKEQRDQARVFNAAGWSVVGIGAAAVAGSVIMFAVMRPKSSRLASLNVSPTAGGLLVGGSW